MDRGPCHCVEKKYFYLTIIIIIVDTGYHNIFSVLSAHAQPVRTLLNLCSIMSGKELGCGVLVGVGAFAASLALYKGVQYIRNRAKEKVNKFRLMAHKLATDKYSRRPCMNAPCVELRLGG